MSQIKVKLQLKCPDGASFKFTFKVDQDEKVKDLKEKVKVHSSFHIQLKNPTLFLNEVALDDDKTVKDYNISENDLLIVKD